MIRCWLQLVAGCMVAMCEIKCVFTYVCIYNNVRIILLLYIYYKEILKLYFDIATMQPATSCISFFYICKSISYKDFVGFLWLHFNYFGCMILFIQKRLLHLLNNKQSESGIDRNHKNSIPYVPKLIPLDFVGDIF